MYPTHAYACARITGCPASTDSQPQIGAAGEERRSCFNKEIDENFNGYFFFFFFPLSKRKGKGVEGKGETEVCQWDLLPQRLLSRSDLNFNSTERDRPP